MSLGGVSMHTLYLLHICWCKLQRFRTASTTNSKASFLFIFFHLRSFLNARIAQCNTTHSSLCVDDETRDCEGNELLIDCQEAKFRTDSVEILNREPRGSEGLRDWNKTPECRLSFPAPERGALWKLCVCDENLLLLSVCAIACVRVCVWCLEFTVCGTAGL